MKRKRTINVAVRCLHVLKIFEISGKKSSRTRKAGKLTIGVTRIDAINTKKLKPTSPVTRKYKNIPMVKARVDWNHSFPASDIDVIPERIFLKVL